jgi:paraquat-inducible protein A
MTFGRGTDQLAPLPADIVACPDCDLLQRVSSLPPGGTACCVRCGLALGSNKPGSLDRTMALAVAALIAFLLANMEPLMEVSFAGRTTSTTILGGVRTMWLQGENVTALLVALFVVVAPALEIMFMLSILLASRRPPAPRWVGALLRWMELSGVWSMVGVMMLGMLVSLVKIASLATVEPGIGIFAVGALVFLLAGMSANFEPREIWLRVRWANDEGPETGR